MNEREKLIEYCKNQGWYTDAKDIADFILADRKRIVEGLDRDGITDVKYDSGAFYPVYYMERSICDEEERPLMCQDVEVIGNIYQNPDLMEARQ